jgi:replication factor C subunit 3/5
MDTFNAFDELMTPSIKTKALKSKQKTPGGKSVTVDCNDWINDIKHNVSHKNMDNNFLPWVEKYRPENMGAVLSQQQNISTLQHSIDKKNLQHMLFYGTSGTGKTSTIIALAKEIYKENYKTMTLIINASEERGIEIIRNKIKDFIITKGLFLKEGDCAFKLVILDEADALTADAQAMLRSVIEKYTINVRFCLVCNHIKKINIAIQSRCVVFKFMPISHESIRQKILEISEKQAIQITDDGIETIIKISKGDMRKVINIMQSTTMIYDSINESNVSLCVGYPLSAQIKILYNSLHKYSIAKCYKIILDLINENSYNLYDIITELVSELLDDYMSKKNTIKQKKYFTNIIKQLKNIEINLSVCPNDSIQIAGIIGIFKS